MQDVVIVAARRTAVGAFGGSLAGISAADLGAHVIKDILASTGVSGDQVDEVLLGQVLTAGCGQNPARQAVIKAGLPEGVPAMTINKVCGSGLKALHLVQSQACLVLQLAILAHCVWQINNLAHIRLRFLPGNGPSLREICGEDVYVRCRQV